MPADRIAGLVSGLVNAKTLTAIVEHLRHEREFVEASIFVERSEDFLFAQDLDPVACARFHVQIPIQSGKVSREPLIANRQNRLDEPYASLPVKRQADQGETD
jgi:hypothetical protein